MPLMAGDEVGLRTGLQFALTTSSIMYAARPLLVELLPPFLGVGLKSESSSPDATGVCGRGLNPRTVASAGAAGAIMVPLGERRVGKRPGVLVKWVLYEVTKTLKNSVAALQPVSVPLQGSPRRRSGSQRGTDKTVRLIRLWLVSTRIWYRKKEVELSFVLVLICICCS
jgi:hypothetical protein